jgi:hypothetical protein
LSRFLPPPATAKCSAALQVIIWSINHLTCFFITFFVKNMSSMFHEFRDLFLTEQQGKPPLIFIYMRIPQSSKKTDETIMHLSISTPVSAIRWSREMLCVLCDSFTSSSSPICLKPPITYATFQVL